jgi:hypothetical protein
MPTGAAVLRYPANRGRERREGYGLSGRRFCIELTTNFLGARGKTVAPQSAIILPTRRWTSRSAQYSGNPIAGDFKYARRSSLSTSSSVVIVILHYNNELEGDWFKFTSVAAINRWNLIRRSVVVLAVTGCVFSLEDRKPQPQSPPSPPAGAFSFWASELAASLAS